MKGELKIKKANLVLLIILSAFSALLLWSYINFRLLRIDNEYHDEFKERLTATIQKETTFYLKDLTPFEWEKAFIIQPYTSKTEMQEIVGKKWTTYKTYPGYLFEKTFFGEYPLDDDLFHKLVFVQGKEIVLDVTIRRSTADFTVAGLERPRHNVIHCGDDFLIIEEKENSYPLIWSTWN